MNKKRFAAWVSFFCMLLSIMGMVTISAKSISEIHEPASEDAPAGEVAKAVASRISDTVMRTGVKPIRLEGSGSEQILSVKVLGADDQPVTGVAFTFLITTPDGEKLTETPEEQNGELVLEDKEEGLYIVALQKKEGYTVPEPVEVKVLPPVKHEVVDVSEKVVSETQIEVSKEDAQFTDKKETESSPAEVLPPPVKPAEKPSSGSSSGSSSDTPPSESSSGSSSDTSSSGSSSETPPSSAEPEPPAVGWQTVEGGRVYITEDGKRLTGPQVIEGIAYRFAQTGLLMGKIGVDVSRYQGTINWTQVRQSGITYAMIRLGYRGYGTGALVLDTKYLENIRAAQEAGIQVGVYFYTQAITEAEAVEEASMCIQYVQGQNLTLPIVIDMEWAAADARTNSLNNAQRTAICNAFTDTIISAGYSAGVYSNKNYLENYINTGSLKCGWIWLAHYTKETNYAGPYSMWQYTAKGTVNGISGSVDMNIWF